jgi:hypothetical protein
MVLGEILIDGVFVIALLTGVACLAFVLFATILERHLLRARRSSLYAQVAGAARTTSSPPARDKWRRDVGSPALRESRG